LTLYATLNRIKVQQAHMTLPQTAMPEAPQKLTKKNRHKIDTNPEKAS
jgi:hypothetical protein